VKQRRTWNQRTWAIVLGGLLTSGTPAWTQEPIADHEPETAAQDKGIADDGSSDALREAAQQGDSLQLDPVTISKEVKSPEAARLTDPVPQTGVRREEFIIRNNRRMGDVIQRLPGVVVGGPVGENRDIELRGLDKSFTRVQVDGVQLPGPGDKREFSVHQLSSFLIESARVIRNPTAEFESDGVAGRVDIRTRQIPKELTFTMDRFSTGASHSATGRQAGSALWPRPTTWNNRSNGIGPDCLRRSQPGEARSIRKRQASACRA
jgi:outer membrane receptor protein involved in Fe transport